eukprot:6729366-Lingulodinium_polyedra.AAC.1
MPRSPCPARCSAWSAAPRWPVGRAWQRARAGGGRRVSRRGRLPGLQAAAPLSWPAGRRQRWLRRRGAA